MSDRDDRNDDRNDDWGSPTDWQRPPGPVGPGPAGYAVPPPSPQYQPTPPGPQPSPGFTGPWSPPPQSYMLPAILVTLFCFLPTGIAAIYFASQVSSKLGVGDLAGAKEASNKAKTWVFVSVGLGVVAYLIIIVGSMSGSSTY